MSLKDSLIRDVERAIDSLRKRATVLEEELEGVWQEEKEARDLLHTLKTGEKPKPEPTPKVKSVKTYTKLSMEDVRDVAQALGEFTTREVADELDCSRNAPTPYLKKLEAAGTITKKTVGTPRGPATVWCFVKPQLRDVNSA